jgi:hypothetical protein
MSIQEVCEAGAWCRWLLAPSATKHCSVHTRLGGLGNVARRVMIAKTFFSA